MNIYDQYMNLLSENNNSNNKQKALEIISDAEEQIELIKATLKKIKSSEDSAYPDDVIEVFSDFISKTESL